MAVATTVPHGKSRRPLANFYLKKVDVTGEQLPQRRRDETLSRTSPQLFEPRNHGRERGSMYVLHIQGAGK